MKKTCIAGLAVLFFGLQTAWADDQPGISQLDWLIGAWRFDDQQLNGNYRETGTRTCAYAMNDRYIRCESMGTTHTGKEREYVFYFNYNSMDARYEMTALNSDYPRKNLYIVSVDESGHVLELVNEAWSADGLVRLNAATVIYDGENSYDWEIRTGRPDPITGAHPITFRDTAERISTE